MAPKKKTTKSQEAPNNKQEALQLAMDAIRKAQGSGAILQGSESVAGVEFFSSQSPSIDKVLGGGWPKGRIVEVMGPESSGKTTLCLHAIAEAQKNGGTAAFVDAEHALDIDYAGVLGVDTEQLLISQPDSGEKALSAVEALTNSGAVDVIVIDSVAALVPEAELEGEMGDAHMGRQARLMGQAMRMLAAKAYRTNTTLIFINQIRMKIGVMFGSPETTPGGNALKFYSSQRVDIRRIGGVKGTGEFKDEFIANNTRVKCIKNKVAPPFRSCEIEIRYGEGIDILTDYINVAEAKGLIEKNGSWYSQGETKIGQGLAQTRQYFQENPEKLEEIKAQLNG